MIGLYSRAYRAALKLLPLWLRDRAGPEMQASFAERMREAPSHVQRAGTLVHEIAGVVRAAVAARAQAQLALGSEPERRWNVLDAALQDLRYAVRTMRRHPAVPLLSVATLALGVGAATAMFSVIDGVLLRPLPFKDPDRIVLVYPTIEEWKTHPSLSTTWQRGRFSAPEFEQWLSTQTVFEDAAALTGGSLRVPNGRGTERVASASATSSLFHMLGVEPLHGRFPTDAETEPVIVMSHEYWLTHHGGNASVIGRDIRINEAPARVIGVLPPGFAIAGVTAELWQPVAMQGGVGMHSMRVLARLRDDVTVGQAEAETSSLLRAMSAAVPGHITHGASLANPVTEATQEIRRPLLILSLASLILLLAACANVAVLLLGAGADRVRELAVRGALGARKTRLGAQLLMESIVMCVTGALAGLLIAAGMIRALLFIAPEGIPRIEHVVVNMRTFLFSAVTAILCGILVGCFPALSMARVNVAGSLRAGATAPGRGRLQKALVVAELGFTTILLVGAGLLTRTMSELNRVDPGFEANGLVTMQLGLPFDRFWSVDAPREERAARTAEYVAGLMSDLAAVPGVTAIAATSDMPYTGDRGTNDIEPEGYVRAPGEVIDVARRIVSGSYFDVMRIPMLEGRALNEADAAPNAEPVMVVTDEFARHFWPDHRWLDRKVGFAEQSYRVVGVIADTREHDLRGDEDKYKFYAAARDPSQAAGNYLIRTALPAAQLASALRDRVWSTDPTIIVTDVVDMRERISGSVAGYSYRMRLMLAFSSMSALFCLLGVYGVMSRAVARRRQELGIRLALGAQRASILSLVLGEGARIGVLGASIGVLGAFAATRALESLIWGVPRTDSATFASIAMVLVLLSLAATAIPARRAARTEPMATLRG